MRKRLVGLLAISAIVAASSAASASARGGRSTAIAHSRPDGKVLVLATGTEDGECSVSGGRMICHDGRSYAIADVEGRCLRVSGGARCMISDPDRAPREGDPFDPNLVETQNSSIDIECGSGSKGGAVYTISDGDGKASCMPDYDVGDRISGGTCTKNGSACAGFDCNHGCTMGNSNCECHIKSAPRKTVGTTD